jgi:hypothetical protein
MTPSMTTLRQTALAHRKPICHDLEFAAMAQDFTRAHRNSEKNLI